MGIDEIIMRIKALRAIPEERERKKALEQLRDDVYALGLYIAWSEPHHDYVILVNER